MNSTEQEQLTRELARMAYACSTTEIPAEKLAVYVECLGDLPFEQVQQVIRSMAMTRIWFPAVAEIRQQVAEGSGLPSAEAAWAMVVARWKRTTPGLPAPDWDAPLEVRQAAIDAGGMYNLRQMSRDDAYKAFTTAYKHRKAEALTLAAPSLPEPSLTGIGAGHGR